MVVWSALQVFDDAERIQAAEDECAREPVHIPGGIQSYGALIAFDASMERVVQVSANVERLLGFGTQALLGAPVERVLEESLRERIRSELAQRQQLDVAIQRTLDVGGSAQPFHIYAYRSSARVVVEFEPEY